MRWHHRARHALAHSLRVRLVALFLLLAFAMTGVFVLGMQYALGVGWRDAARPLVMDYVDRLTEEIGSPPSVQRAQAVAQRLPLTVRISGPVVNWRSNPHEPDYQHQWHERMDDSTWGNDRPRFFERLTPDGHRIQFGLNVQIWHDQPRLVGWATLGVLLTLTALAYIRVRRMLHPLDDIRTGALRFGAGDFAQPIAVAQNHHPDELSDLARTINTMGADIHRMLEAKRALLLAISHELRSPLTRARLNTELLPETPEVQPGREALLRDLALMRDLVTDLLESERLANPGAIGAHAALHRERVDLCQLVRDEVLSLPGAPVVTQIFDHDLTALSVDPVRVRLLVRNLLDNALRHSVNVAQPPAIYVRSDTQGGAEIAVRDFGSGVPDEQLPNLGQAFYRPDAARTREGGGVGLGLYLCRLVAQAHGGSFSVSNAQPGLEVRVVLPRVVS